jgi:sulfatase maturation enzyme AslB (radical SAM superfamily)
VSSFTHDDLRTFTQPLCSAAQYDAKLRNLEVIEQSFNKRDESCPGLPTHLHVEASANCNLHCSICPCGRGLIQRNGLLPFDTFARVFDKLSNTLANIMVSGWGEPLLNPETTKMIRLATSNGVSVFMNSNGTLLLENVEKILDSGLTAICVALDGAMSHATHAYDAELRFERVVRGVEQLRAAKDRGGLSYPHIQGVFIVTEDTIAEIEKLASWASRLGIERVKFKRKMGTMPGQMKRDQLISAQETLNISAYPSIRSEEKLTFSVTDCSHPWSSLYLDCLGHLGICSWDPHRIIDLGEPGEDLISIWNGAQIRTVRRWHSGKDLSVGDPCLTCNRVPGYLAHQINC